MIVVSRHCHNSNSNNNDMLQYVIGSPPEFCHCFRDWKQIIRYCSIIIAVSLFFLLSSWVLQTLRVRFSEPLSILLNLKFVPTDWKSPLPSEMTSEETELSQWEYFWKCHTKMFNQSNTNITSRDMKSRCN